MSRSVAVSGGRAVATVDDADFALVMNGHAWTLHNGGYALQRIGRAGSTTYMHRLIMSAPPGLEVDHINRDKLDNRRSNLRLATRVQNATNQAPRSAHGFRGISLAPSGRWNARLRYAGTTLRLGRFDTPEEAVGPMTSRRASITGSLRA